MVIKISSMNKAEHFGKHAQNCYMCDHLGGYDENEEGYPCKLYNFIVYGIDWNVCDDFIDESD